MTMNPLPPQAYTKETLLKAYNWLNAQHSSIREIATTPDILVSLYLKATRDGDSALDRPSIQNFKNELRNLAGLMGELDRAPNASGTSGLLTHSGPFYDEKPTPAPATPVAPAASSSTQPAANNQSSASQGAGAVSAGASTTAKTAAPKMALNLDAASQMMIQEVKENFNLSSEMEALRMLIKVGYTHTQGVLK